MVFVMVIIMVVVMVLVMVVSVVEDLNTDVLEVVEVLEDAIIIHTTVERVTVRALVRVDTVVTVVVELGVDIQVRNGCVMSAIGHSHEEIELHAVLVTLREQEPVGDPQGTLVLLQVQVLAVVKGVVNMSLQLLETGHVGDSHARVGGLADDVVPAGVHCGR